MDHLTRVVAVTAKKTYGAGTVWPGHTHRDQKGTHRPKMEDNSAVEGAAEAEAGCSPAGPCSAKGERHLQQRQEEGWHRSIRMGQAFERRIAGLAAGRLGFGTGMPSDCSLRTAARQRLAGMAGEARMNRLPCIGHKAPASVKGVCRQACLADSLEMDLLMDTTASAQMGAGT